MVTEDEEITIELWTMELVCNGASYGIIDTFREDIKDGMKSRSKAKMVIMYFTSMQKSLVSIELEN